MQLHKTGVVLLALLLAAMAMVPMVNAATGEQNSGVISTEVTDNAILSNDKIAMNYIPIETAHDHALIKMIEFTRNGLVDDSWKGAIINPNPVVIYDMDGRKLFYQFAVEKDGKKIGEILSSASKVLGVSVQLFGDPSPYDTSTVQNNVKDLAKKKFPGFTVQSTKMVCYSYPKIGVMVHLVNAKTREEKDVVYDAIYLSEIPQKKPAIDGDAGTFSYYNLIPETTFPEKIAQWNKLDNTVNDIKNKATAQGIDISQGISDNNTQTLNQIISASTTGVFEYEELPRGFPTIDQGSTQWCQVATAWVITKYYDRTTSRTLNSIAAKMLIPDTQHTARWDNELNYYTSSYPSGGLGKIDSYYRMTSPPLAYETVKTEIHNTRPLKVGYQGHSRACIGYSRNPAGDTYYKFSNSWGGVLQWEAAPNLYGSISGYNEYIIVQ